MRNSTLLVGMIASSVVGLAVSAYLTYLSYMPQTSCPIGDYGFFSCNEVIWSEYSHFFGVAVAVLGLGWFIIATGLVLSVWRYPRFVLVLTMWSILGGLGVAAFVFVEVFLLGSICPLCTVAHVAGLALLGLSLVALRKHRNTS